MRWKVAALPNETQRLVAANYPSIAADLLQPLLAFCNVGRDVCGGDMDKVLLMLIIGVRTTQHADFARFTPDQLASGEVPILPSLGINVRSIAESTGMPKETARRKVLELVEMGWLTKEGNDLRYTAEGYQAVAPARETIEALAARYHAVVERLVERGG